MSGCVHAWSHWIEECVPFFFSMKERLDWEATKPDDYEIPPHIRAFCFNTVRVYGVRKKDNHSPAPRCVLGQCEWLDCTVVSYDLVFHPHAWM